MKCKYCSNKASQDSKTCSHYTCETLAGIDRAKQNMEKK